MTKILTRQCSIPDINGDYKESKVELNVIYAIQFDMELYNYVDVVIRDLRMGTLADRVKGNSKATVVDKEQVGGEGNEEDDDDETKKVEGIWAIPIGPDNVPLKRNSSDVMNNFFIN